MASEAQAKAAWRPAAGEATADLSRYRLRLPGPSPVPLRVRQAMAGPMLNHRGPEFRAAPHEAIELLRPIFGTRNDVLAAAAGLFGTG